MPLLTSVGNIAAKGFGFANVILDDSNYMAWLTGSPGFYISDVNLTANNTLLVPGANKPGTDNPALVVISPKGYLTLQKKYSTSYGQLRSGKVDSSGNYYAASNQTTPQLGIYKFSSSGSLLSTAGLTVANGSGNERIIINSAGEIIALGNGAVSSTVSAIQYTKYNSSLSILEQFRISNATVAISPNDVCIDSSGNIYILSSYYLAPNQYIVILKLDSSNNVAWTYKYSLGNSDVTSSAITVDSSGNIYVVGNYQANNSISFLIKFNSSGTCQWTKILSRSAKYVWTNSVSISPDSNYIYTSGYTGDFSVAYWWFNKYDLSGNLQYQKSITASGVLSQGSVIRSTDDNLYFGGTAYVSSAWKGYFASLPSDGSKTGSYALAGYTFVYANGTLTDGTRANPSQTSHVAYSKTTTTYSAASLTTTPADLTNTLTTKTIY